MPESGYIYCPYVPIYQDITINIHWLELELSSNKKYDIEDKVTKEKIENI